MHVGTCHMTVRVICAINVPTRGDQEDSGKGQDWRGDWEEDKNKVWFPFV